MNCWPTFWYGVWSQIGKRMDCINHLNTYVASMIHYQNYIIHLFGKTYRKMSKIPIIRYWKSYMIMWGCSYIIGFSDGCNDGSEPSSFRYWSFTPLLFAAWTVNHTTNGHTVSGNVHFQLSALPFSMAITFIIQIGQQSNTLAAITRLRTPKGVSAHPICRGDLI